MYDLNLLLVSGVAKVASPTEEAATNNSDDPTINESQASSKKSGGLGMLSSAFR